MGTAGVAGRLAAPARHRRWGQSGRFKHSVPSIGAHHSLLMTASAAPGGLQVVRVRNGDTIVQRLAALDRKLFPKSESWGGESWVARIWCGRLQLMARTWEPKGSSSPGHMALWLFMRRLGGRRSGAAMVSDRLQPGVGGGPALGAVSCVCSRVPTDVPRLPPLNSFYPLQTYWWRRRSGATPSSSAPCLRAPTTTAAAPLAA